MKILIIDDSRSVRMMIQRMLKSMSADIEVVEAADGREGLRQLRKNPDVSLALVDWNLPEITGIDFVRIVRDDPTWNDVRLIMVTTETDISNVRLALESGANEYIMKPFTKDILINKIEMIGMQLN